MALYSVMITFPPTLAEQLRGVRIGSSKNPVIEAKTPSGARAIARKRYPGGTVVRVSAHAGRSL